LETREKLGMDEYRERYAAFVRFPGRRMDMVRSLMDRILDFDTAEVERFLADVVRDEHDPIVRHEAIFLVGVLVNWGMCKGEVAAPLIRRGAIEERSTVVRHESVEALANFRSVESVGVLERALQDADADVRATAVISLERLSYQDVDDDARLAAQQVLERAGLENSRS